MKLLRDNVTQLPLDPVRDLYQPSFFSGNYDPELGVLLDVTRPLIFLAVDGTETVKMVETPLGKVQIFFE